MESTHRRLQRFAVIARGPFGDEFIDALQHLARGFVGEGDRQNVLRRNTLINHVRHPMSYRVGLARAGPCQNQHRPANGLRGNALFRIQAT